MAPASINPAPERLPPMRLTSPPQTLRILPRLIGVGKRPFLGYHGPAIPEHGVMEGMKEWYKIDFVPKMSRVMRVHKDFGKGYGRATQRAMADGALNRKQKETGSPTG